MRRCATLTDVRRPILSLLSLCLLLGACGGDSSETTTRDPNEPFPTAIPAPEIEGESIEIPPVAVAQPVAIGLSARQSLDVHVLPGLDQPMIGQTAASSELEFLGEVFETEDDIIWWLIRFDGLQGWVQPDVGFRGPATDVTDQVSAAIGADETFASPDELAARIGILFAEATGATETMTVDTTLATTSATNVIDLLGVGDADLQFGLRLAIDATNDGSGWTARSVQQFPLCTKNVTPAGACTS